MIRIPSPTMCWFMLLTHLLCLFLLLPFTSSLIVSFSPTDIRQFDHVTAAFGPGSFNITYPLVLSSPRLLCTATEDSYLNQIVLISRGNCTFAEKVYAAQHMGAAGVIIGNTPDQSPGYVEMPLPRDFQHPIIIPSIFISSQSHDMIRRYICGNVTDDGCTTNTVIGEEPVMATMNYMGELINPYDDYSASDTLKMAGFLLLILPVLWCLVAATCLIRKICRERRARQARNDVARHMPMVAYRRMSAEPATEETRLSVRSPASPPRIHNESCAICLEDFTPEMQIKLLPCGHGFHQNCIDPWLNERSELCPICKSSILDHKQPRGLLGGCVDIVCCR